MFEKKNTLIIKVCPPKSNENQFKGYFKKKKCISDTALIRNRAMFLPRHQIRWDVDCGGMRYESHFL